MCMAYLLRDKKTNQNEDALQPNTENLTFFIKLIENKFYRVFYGQECEVNHKNVLFYS